MTPFHHVRRYDDAAMPPTLEVVVADITTLDVDAIVNAANSGLSGGGGVDGAIHRAAGPELAPAARAAGPCPTGHAGHDARLPVEGTARDPCRRAGMGWRRPRRGRAAGACYAKSLALAGEAGLASIAFPAISTGVYGFPKDRATWIAINTVMREAPLHASLSRVVFCCFSESDGARYRGLLAAATA